MNGYTLRETVLDGERTLVLACPGCGKEQYLDDDQARGSVSTECFFGCGFHETTDWWSVHAAQAANA